MIVGNNVGNKPPLNSRTHVLFVTKIIQLESLDETITQSEPPGNLAWDKSLSRGGVISIGNFDGVHLGHVSLLRRVRELANLAGVSATIVSFEPHPAAVLRPTDAPLRLMTMERRAEVMSEYRIDQLLVCPVTPSFLQLSATDFFGMLVNDCLETSAMVEGPNFYFGRGREGDLTLLKKLCLQNRIDLEIITPSENSEGMISSTRIRRLLETGEVEMANQLLSHPHQIKGVVAAGAGRGREIGFPTANLTDVDVLVPGVGVYGGTALIDGEKQLAAIHVGPNPTFEDDNQRKIEVHLLDYDGDLYGKTIEVAFLLRLRDVVRFSSTNELILQLETDVAAVRNYSFTN